ncbi:hypothetical protein T09_8458 [Trichinella sp. T9]|nr:hypothetical protein T09_8458 [Trichinella sp. T9]
MQNNIYFQFSQHCFNNIFKKKASNRVKTKWPYTQRTSSDPPSVLDEPRSFQVVAVFATTTEAFCLCSNTMNSERDNEKKKLCKGDIVLVTEDNVKRENWPRGRITSIFP